MPFAAKTPGTRRFGALNSDSSVYRKVSQPEGSASGQSKRTSLLLSLSLGRKNNITSARNAVQSVLDRLLVLKLYWRPPVLRRILGIRQPSAADQLR